MINDIEEHVAQYWKMLRDKTQITMSIDGNIAEITTPYLDSHNDYIQVYAINEDHGLRITDDSYTIDDLEMCGVDVHKGSRSDLLKIALNGFGVKCLGNELYVHSGKANFAMKKHNLIQAILAINDMFYLSKPVINSIFLELVIEWMTKHEIRYSQNIKLTGKSGYDHNFDFLIPSSTKKPERLLKAINRPNKTSAESVIMAWTDTREKRPKKATSIVLLNDIDNDIPDPVLEALANYDIEAIPWSNEKEVAESLAA